MAKLLFSSLFQSVFDEIENERTEKEADELVQKINQALNEMLRCSSLFFAPFLSFILVSRVTNDSHFIYFKCSALVISRFFSENILCIKSV